MKKKIILMITMMLLLAIPIYSYALVIKPGGGGQTPGQEITNTVPTKVTKAPEKKTVIITQQQVEVPTEPPETQPPATQAPTQIQTEPITQEEITTENTTETTTQTANGVMVDVSSVLLTVQFDGEYQSLSDEFTVEFTNENSKETFTLIVDKKSDSYNINLPLGTYELSIDDDENECKLDKTKIELTSPDNSLLTLNVYDVSAKSGEVASLIKNNLIWIICLLVSIIGFIIYKRRHSYLS